ncbi:T9SS type A sorting domain-containing protein [Flavivirga eckloniae]|nr:T9SS type A sorting domain-containing protein [Flavivirga eckloniae]
MKQILHLIFLIPFFCLSQTPIGTEISSAGHSVSLSSNGSIVAIGNPFNNTNGNNSGHVQIYQKTSTGWVKMGNDIEGIAAENRLGYSVSISKDNSTVAIGAPNKNKDATSLGYVSIYKNESGTWTKMGNNIDGTLLNSEFGASVSLSYDGSIVAIGEPSGKNNNGHKTGQVQVYNYNTTSKNWELLGNGIYGEEYVDNLGHSISLSSNGNVIAIGAPYNNGSLSDPKLSIGSVKVYEYNLSSKDWIQIGLDIDGVANSDYLGASVSLSKDGDIVAIGATSIGSKGYVKVFENISGTWTLIGNVIDGEASSEEAGTSVSLSANGDIVAIGAPSNNENGNDSGQVRIYKNISGNWQKIGDGIEGKTPNSVLGLSVSLSDDGSFIAIGALGHVDIYDLSPVLSSDSFALSQFSMFPNPSTYQTTIKLNKGLTLKKVAIYNNLGQFIESTQKDVINTSQLSSGLYYVKITTNKGEATKKLIIE